MFQRVAVPKNCPSVIRFKITLREPQLKSIFMKNLFIIGAGGYGREVASYIKKSKNILDKGTSENKLILL